MRITYGLSSWSGRLTPPEPVLEVESDEVPDDPPDGAAVAQAATKRKTMNDRNA